MQFLIDYTQTHVVTDFEHVYKTVSATQIRIFTLPFSFHCSTALLLIPGWKAGGLVPHYN